MYQTQFRLFACAALMGLGAALGASARTAAEPCQEIVAACERAGFVQGNAREGTGLQVDCVRPILQGTPPTRTTLQLPQVDPKTLADCKAREPNLGQQREASAPAALAPIPPVSDVPQPVHPAAPGAPNIVFILTDDLSWNLVQYMPHV